MEAFADEQPSLVLLVRRGHPVRLRADDRFHPGMRKLTPGNAAKPGFSL
jgi:hypothetical protein